MIPGRDKFGNRVELKRTCIVTPWRELLPQWDKFGNRVELKEQRVEVTKGGRSVAVEDLLGLYIDGARLGYFRTDVEALARFVDWEAKGR